MNVKDEVDWAKKLREDSITYRERIEKERNLQMLRTLAPARDLSDYVGVYENTLYGQIEVRKEGDNLLLVYRDRPKTQLRHWNA
ncbi:DUF3471 domain-containing protein, partial [Acinetobacter baumannii]